MTKTSPSSEVVRRTGLFKILCLFTRQNGLSGWLVLGQFNELHAIMKFVIWSLPAIMQKPINENFANNGQENFIKILRSMGKGDSTYR